MIGALLLNLRQKSGVNRLNQHRNEDLTPPYRSVWAIRRREFNELADKIKRDTAKKVEQAEAKKPEGDDDAIWEEFKTLRDSAKELEKALEAASDGLESLSKGFRDPEALLTAEARAVEFINRLEDQLMIREMVDHARAMGKLKEMATAILNQDAEAIMTILALDEASDIA